VAPGTDGSASQAPLPAFDTGVTDRLDPPGGVVRLQSSYYVRREVDRQALARITADEGATVSVKGFGQSGKSSLLARLFQGARDRGHPALYVDFRAIDGAVFASLDTLLRSFADLLTAKLQTSRTPANVWQEPIGAKDKLTDFLTKEILPHCGPRPLVLLLDHVDRVFQFAYRDDFFSLLRYWDDYRVFEPALDRLTLVVAYSTEAFLFIKDLNQSPFTAGHYFTLDDFELGNLEEMNRAHGSPVAVPKQLALLMEWLGGHPYLTRRAFYYLVQTGESVDTLMNRAVDDDGPFGDHLRRYLFSLARNPGLRDSMKSALDNGTCSDDLSFYLLRSAGLVRGHRRNAVTPRCKLYQAYFGARL
jgi:hypothetical protein